MKIKHETFFLLALLGLLATSCSKNEQLVSSIVNLSSVDITIHYTRFINASGSASVTLSPHQEFITSEVTSTYYQDPFGSHIGYAPHIAMTVDSITSSLGKVVNHVDTESYEYKKGRVPFHKHVSIVRDASF